MSKKLVESLREPADEDAPIRIRRLMDEAADLIERQRIALDSAMMVVWWAVSEGFVPIDCYVDPEQVMIDNIQTITRDDGAYWEQMFQGLSQRRHLVPREG